MFFYTYLTIIFLTIGNEISACCFTGPPVLRALQSTETITRKFRLSPDPEDPKFISINHLQTKEYWGSIEIKAKYRKTYVQWNQPQVAARWLRVSPIKAIRNLIGEPDYRKVRLHWESDGAKFPQSGYQVRYCELQSWGVQRCRIQRVIEPEESNSIPEDGAKSYEANVIGLRMATTYSFEIKQQKEGGNREDRADDDDKQNTIVIPTKGFSARATQCLPHASVIEVSTGPYFGGRIAVEATDGERCAVDGEPTSEKDVYTLKINHTECGSQVNETTVATFVIVQENLPILTHSTRRFLVLCSYQPETLTVRAGLSLPTTSKGHSQAVPAEQNDNSRRSRHLRPAKLFQEPEALVTKEEEIKRSVQQSEKSIPIALLAIFMTMGLIGLLVAAIKCGSKRIANELDNVSIASSETSCGSCVTAIDGETISENTLSRKNSRALEV